MNEFRCQFDRALRKFEKSDKSGFCSFEKIENREFKGSHRPHLKRWVLSFERNVETDNELRVSGGREFQSLGAMTEKALLPRDVRTFGMDRTDESDDLVDRE